MSASSLLDQRVSDVLATCPGAARALLERRMSCAGCPFARFETLAEVAAIYRRDALELARAITDAGLVVTPESE